MTRTMRGRLLRRLPFLAATGLLLAQIALGEQREIRVEIPEDVPLELVSSDFGGTEFEPRGGALVIELAGSIRFRHRGPNAVRAVTLDVDAHRELMGGRAVVAVPSLNARDGEEFEVPIYVRLIRALPLPAGPAVRIATDAVLFDTLAYVGPNRLDSARKLKTRELEARRDRNFFLSRWESGGREALAEAMQASLLRQASRPRLEIRLAGAGPATAGRRAEPREIQLAFVQHDGDPLLFESGSALVTGFVSEAPRIRMRNRTTRTIRQFDVGWLAADGDGTVYSVGSAPADYEDVCRGRGSHRDPRRRTLRTATCRRPGRASDRVDGCLPEECSDGRRQRVDSKPTGSGGVPAASGAASISRGAAPRGALPREGSGSSCRTNCASSQSRRHPERAALTARDGFFTAGGPAPVSPGIRAISGTASRRSECPC